MERQDQTDVDDVKEQVGDSEVDDSPDHRDAVDEDRADPDNVDEDRDDLDDGEEDDVDEDRDDLDGAEEGGTDPDQVEQGDPDIEDPLVDSEEGLSDASGDQPAAPALNRKLLDDDVLGRLEDVDNTTEERKQAVADLKERAKVADVEIVEVDPDHEVFSEIADRQGVSKDELHAATDFDGKTIYIRSEIADNPRVLGEEITHIERRAKDAELELSPSEREIAARQDLIDGKDDLALTDEEVALLELEVMHIEDEGYFTPDEEARQLDHVSGDAAALAALEREQVRDRDFRENLEADVNERISDSASERSEGQAHSDRGLTERGFPSESMLRKWRIISKDEKTGGGRLRNCLANPSIRLPILTWLPMVG